MVFKISDPHPLFFFFPDLSRTNFHFESLHSADLNRARHHRSDRAPLIGALSLSACLATPFISLQMAPIPFKQGPSSAKRAAAAVYDYEGDPRWSEYWSNVLLQLKGLYA